MNIRQQADHARCLGIAKFKCTSPCIKCGSDMRYASNQRCIKCDIAISIKYNAENSEAINSLRVQWYEDNKDRINAERRAKTKCNEQTVKAKPNHVLASEAKAQGFKKWEHTKPCNRCSTTLRHSSRGAKCVQCKTNENMETTKNRIRTAPIVIRKTLDEIKQLRAERRRLEQKFIEVCKTDISFPALIEAAAYLNAHYTVIQMYEFWMQNSYPETLRKVIDCAMKQDDPRKLIQYADVTI
jgi:hypothetical protein